MNRKTILTILAMVAFALAQTPGQAQSDNDNKWSFDVSLNGLAAGLSGSTTVHGVHFLLTAAES